MKLLPLRLHQASHIKKKIGLLYAAVSIGKQRLITLHVTLCNESSETGHGPAQNAQTETLDAAFARRGPVLGK